MERIPKFLLLESATSVCSVCLCEGTEILTLRETLDANKHSQFLASYAQQCIESMGMSYKDLAAVGVCSGPGSYTGLRVGASVAKGICFAVDVPLIGIDNLEALAWGAKPLSLEKDVIVPMIDARRMEVYMASFDSEINRLTPNSATILNVNMFDTLIDQGHRILIVGDGTSKAAHVFKNNQHILCHPNIISSSKQMIQPTMLAFLEQRFENVYQFAPGYLKAPNITKSRKSML